SSLLGQAGRVTAAARAGHATLSRAEIAGRLGRAVIEHRRTRRAVHADGHTVVAEAARARPRTTDRTRHEAGFLSARRARRAMDDGALAVRVDVAIPDGVAYVMRHAAHVLPVVARAGTGGVDRRTDLRDAWIIATRIRV